MEKMFTWKPIYSELAEKLRTLRPQSQFLIDFLIDLRENKKLIITPLLDKNDDGERVYLDDIDPFTFFGTFNRQLTIENRIAILKAMKNKFELESPLPSDFEGIPTIMNKGSWFFPYFKDRRDDDIDRLWRVFELALSNNPLDNIEFKKALDDALSVKYTNINLTIGLYWIRSDYFLNLDRNIRNYLNIQLPKKKITAEFYINTTRQILELGIPLSRISYEAYHKTKRLSDIQLDDPLPVKSEEILDHEDIRPYGIQNIIDSGVFVPENTLKLALQRLHEKRNLIIQGPPGVGKTFIAHKLAYAFMGVCDSQRIEMIQFHQTYSYDDFIRGYRPDPEQLGNFNLKDGVFLKFCGRARKDIERPYIFVIDEINRGNLSQIFGEVLMLIEVDKRNTDFAVSLVYQHSEEELFYIPENIYLIGLMNLADRSLAMVDYALRRRFSFISIEPQFRSGKFREWLLSRHMDVQLVDLIVNRMTTLNEEIAKDDLLGENYQIGHSFFVQVGKILKN